MDKRRHQRMEVDNMMVDISDGKGFFTGTVSDLSRFGLLISNIPKKMDEKAEKLSVVITGQGKHFKMKARSRWVAPQALNKKIGVELLNAPWGWTEFVMNFEPHYDDIWEKVAL